MHAHPYPLNHYLQILCIRHGSLWYALSLIGSGVPMYFPFGVDGPLSDLLRAVLRTDSAVKATTVTVGGGGKTYGHSTLVSTLCDCKYLECKGQGFIFYITVHRARSA